jgi:hypothetical protein
MAGRRGVENSVFVFLAALPLGVLALKVLPLGAKQNARK